MFGENKSIDNNKDKVKTVFGKGTRIEGDISTGGSLRVDGEVIGKIRADGDVYVGESGSIKNEIEARNIIIAGKVESNVLAHEKLEILPSGKLSGDIKTDVLVIEKGAKFVGTSQILEKSVKKENNKDNKEKENNKKQKNKKKDNK